MRERGEERRGEKGKKEREEERRETGEKATGREGAMAHHWLILFITEPAEAAMWCPQGDHSSISPATLVVSHWGL